MVKAWATPFRRSSFGIGVLVLWLLGSSLAAAQGFGSTNDENSKKPINIDADHVQVDDLHQLAIFTGNVIAIQGENTLRTVRLEVVYERAPPAGSTKDSPKSSSGKALPAVSAATSSPGAASSNQQIKNMTAIGNVIVTSTKDGQTATGDRGFYDVKSQKVTITVDPKSNHYVVLTQTGNIAKGKKLAIDMNTGVAIIDPPDDPRGGVAIAKHRVSTVLIPGSKGAPGLKAAGADANGKGPLAPASSPAKASDAPASQSSSPFDWLTGSR